MCAVHSDSLLKYYTRPDDSREPSIHDGGGQRICRTKSVNRTPANDRATRKTSGKLVDRALLFFFRNSILCGDFGAAKVRLEVIGESFADFESDFGIPAIDNGNSKSGRRHRVQLRSFVFVKGHLNARNSLQIEKFIDC